MKTTEEKRAANRLRVKRYRENKATAYTARRKNAEYQAAFRAKRKETQALLNPALTPQVSNAKRVVREKVVTEDDGEWDELIRVPIEDEERQAEVLKQHEQTRRYFEQRRAIDRNEEAGRDGVKSGARGIGIEESVAGDIGVGGRGGAGEGELSDAEARRRFEGLKRELGGGRGIECEV